MNHTPTPWKEGETHFAYPLNITMLLLSGNDFQRAKNCVNACAEFSDPKIDIGLLNLHAEQQTKLLASCEAALAERDKEIAKLKELAVEVNILEKDGHIANKMIEPDYKTLYTELLQGVKDAKAEMNNQFRKKLYADTVILGMAYNNCIEILTDKTGIL